MPKARKFYISRRTDVEDRFLQPDQGYLIETIPIPMRSLPYPPYSFSPSRVLFLKSSRDLTDIRTSVLNFLRCPAFYCPWRARIVLTCSILSLAA